MTTTFCEINQILWSSGQWTVNRQWHAGETKWWKDNPNSVLATSSNWYFWCNCKLNWWKCHGGKRSHLKETLLSRAQVNLNHIFGINYFLNCLLCWFVTWLVTFFTKYKVLTCLIVSASDGYICHCQARPETNSKSFVKTSLTYFLQINFKKNTWLSFWGNILRRLPIPQITVTARYNWGETHFH